MPHVDRDAPYVTLNLPPTVSAEERKRLRESHVQCKVFISLTVCDECLDDWPCPTIRTLDALEHAERELATLRGVVREMLEDAAPFPHQLSYQVFDKARNLVTAAQEATDADA